MKLFGCQERVCGRDRQVFIFKDIVIKLPVVDSWIAFVRGLASNLKEHETISTYKGKFPDHIPEIKWMGLGGLILVMKRYQEVHDTSVHRQRFYKHLERRRGWDNHEWNFVWDGDNKVFNYAWDKYGRLIKIDLGIYY